MFVPVCDRPSMAEPTEAQERAVMETKTAAIHQKIPILARQLPITGSAHKAGVVGAADQPAVGTVLDMPAQRRRPARSPRARMGVSLSSGFLGVGRENPIPPFASPPV